MAAILDLTLNIAGRKIDTRRIRATNSQQVAAVINEYLTQVLDRIGDCLLIDPDAMDAIGWAMAEYMVAYIRANFSVFGVDGPERIHVVTGSLQDAIAGDLLRKENARDLGNMSKTSAVIQIFVDENALRNDPLGFIKGGQKIVTYRVINEEDTRFPLNLKYEAPQMIFERIFSAIRQNLARALLGSKGMIRMNYDRVTLQAVVAQIESMTNELQSQAEQIKAQSLAARAREEAHAQWENKHMG